MTNLGDQDDLATLGTFKTKQALAYEALREAIITCRFPPGKRLLEVELAQQLGISRSPVREALKRLAHEGLVTEIPHLGVTVSDVALDSLHELYLILAALAGLACGEATAVRSTETLAALEQELQAMDLATAADDYIGWVQHDRAFHDLGRKDCALPQLQRMLAETQGRMSRFQIYRGAASERAIHSRPEHRAIYDAMTARDAERVEQLVRAHYLAGDRAFKEYLHGMPEDPNYADPSHNSDRRR